MVTVPEGEDKETVEGPVSAKPWIIRVLSEDRWTCIVGCTAGVIMHPAIVCARQRVIRMRRQRLIAWEVQIHFANDGGRQKMINVSTIN